jgi:DNA modification methylase
MLVVECPKRYADNVSTSRSNYDYYAGYSNSFSETLLKYIPTDEDTIVLDPWNGAGTTTLAASNLGLKSYGFDLNPAMVVIAKARLIQNRTIPSILPIWNKINADFLEHIGADTPKHCDPLESWFTPDAAATIRALERTIRMHLISQDFLGFSLSQELDKVSDVAAYFYLALFNAIRKHLRGFKASNPTWIRRAKDPNEKLPLAREELSLAVASELSMQTGAVRPNIAVDTKITPTTLSVGNSESIPLSANSVDIVLTSPPYCTRIDYAVATAPELAILGFGEKTTYAALRSMLMGTTTVTKEALPVDPRWGDTCIEFLNKLSNHPSIASQTYYKKNHLKYFSSLHRSLNEISRVLKGDGIASIVVQDSRYKDIHNNLIQITIEMAEKAGLLLFQRDDYPLGVSLVNINKKSRGYQKEKFHPTESVISFYKG